jgi:hypothetical protein
VSEINSYELLSGWLREDLGQIGDERAIADLRSFLETLDAAGDPPAWRASLSAALDRIAEQSSPGEGLRILNESLSELFLATTFTLADYEAKLDALETGDELANRLKARNPLPTIDVLVQFEADPRPLTQCVRASLLTVAALELQQAGEKGGGTVPVLGTTLAPGLDRDRIAHAEDSGRILVLSRGVAYVINLGESVSDPAPLARTLEWIQADAAQRNPSGIFPLATAARRSTCFEVRCVLETDSRNARAFAEVENCLFAVCLDDGASHARLETLCRKFFGNCENRWYGMTCLVIDGSAEAGLIGSYGRGIDGVPGLAFCQALQQRAARTAVPKASDRNLLDVRRVEFSGVDLGELERRARAEVESAFHADQCFWELNIGSSFFLRHNLSTTPVLNYLILLAAQATFDLPALPALSHAVAGRSNSERKGGTDWVIASTRLLAQASAAGTESEWFAAVVQAAEDHANHVKASRRGYSPSYFIAGPRSVDDRQLFEFFVRIGERYATGYRSYLFRPTRWPGTMDILTSTLILPEGISYIGRAGATSDVATIFGAHIIVEEERIRLFMLPGIRGRGRLAEFHSNLKHLVARFKAAAWQGASRLTAPSTVGG